MNKDYTWGDIVIATCRKMFLNKDAITVADLPDLIDDRNYSTYINMAPDVMNELMVILNNRVLINIDTITIKLDDANLEKYLIDDNSAFVFDIKEYMKDNEIDNYLYTEVIQHTYIKRDNLLFEEQDGKLYIDKRFIDINSLTLTIKYRIIPERFTTTTPWNTLIDLPYNICSIVPLYLASELYKDDDISMSTAYRNQFEAELDYISSQMVDSLGVEHSRDVGDYYG